MADITRNEWIGVVSYTDPSSAMLKRGALLFDKLVTARVDVNGSSDTIESLVKLGIVQERLSLMYKRRDGDIHRVDEELLYQIKRITEEARESRWSPRRRGREAPTFVELCDVFTRFYASRLAKSETTSTVLPLITSFSGSAPPPAKRATVLTVILNELPLPDADTPWEAIVDWRVDDDAKVRYQRLRAWVGRMCRSELSPSEIVDELGVLMSDYSTYMRRHHRTMRISRAEVVVTTIAGVLEDLLHVKLGGAVERLFSLLKTEATLSEVELAAPGREIAYVVAAGEQFAPRSGSG